MSEENHLIKEVNSETLYLHINKTLQTKFTFKGRRPKKKSGIRDFVPIGLLGPDAKFYRPPKREIQVTFYNGNLTSDLPSKTFEGNLTHNTMVRVRFQ